MLHSDPPSSAPAPVARTPRRRRRLLVVAALAVVLGLVGAACKQIDPNNRAAAVPGVTNGNLPMSYLGSTANGCVVYDEALASLKAMIAHAAADDITLRGIGCYRDYAGQVAVRQDWCNRGRCDMAAVPGSSNHGWGKAVDFADQKGELTFDSIGYAWLKAWAGVYGWMHPKSMEPDGPIPEPWHWEWVGDGGKMYPGEYAGIGNAPLTEPRGLPFGHFDLAVANPDGTSVTVAGWAIDPDTTASIPVHVYVDDRGYAVTANHKRPDVAEVFPLYKSSPHGFHASVPATPGVHQVCAYAINVAGTGWNRLLGCTSVTVVPPAAPAAQPAPAAPTTTVAPPATTSTTGAPRSTTSTTGAPASTTTVAQAPSQGAR